MFEFESCYIGYQILYSGGLYYVFDDDEKYLYLNKITLNGYDMPGIIHDGIKYSFDYDNVVKIDKHHTYYKIHKSFPVITYEQYLDNKLKVLSGDIIIRNSQKPRMVYETGDVLSIKKYNHKVICIAQLGIDVFYVVIKNNMVLSDIKRTTISKIKKVYDRLNEDEISKLLIDVQTNLNYNDNYYLEDLKGHINECLKKN